MPLVLLAVLALASIIVTPLVASHKKRSFWRWLLWASMFGAVALIVILLLPPLEQKKPSRRRPRPPSPRDFRHSPYEQ